MENPSSQSQQTLAGLPSTAISSAASDKPVGVPTAYFSDKTKSLSASLFCAFYSDALLRTKHDVAFDAAFYHQSTMLGENAIPVADAKAIIDSLNSQGAQVLRCTRCNAMFLASQPNTTRTTCPSGCLA